MAALTRGLLVVAFVLTSTPASAQRLGSQPRPSTTHWGITASVTPQWEFLRILEDAMDKVVDMSGDEFRIGIVRGKQLGGEWGISYVKRRVDDGSTVLQEKPKCLVGVGATELCASGTSYRTRGAFMNGVQWHRFFPIGTVAGRVQFGGVVTGGIARIEGHADQTLEHLQVIVNASTGAAMLTTGAETQLVEARSILSHTFAAEYLPIGGVEGAVAVLPAPGMKLRFSAGVAFPGMHRLSLTAQYLFGAR